MVQTIAKALWGNFIVHYGLPEKILSDQGRNLKSKLIADLCKLMWTKKLRTSPYYFQTNGWCKRFNSTLINILTLRSITAHTSTNFMQKWGERIRWAHRKADLFQQKEVWHHKHNYDKQSEAVSLRTGDMVLVGITAFKG